MKLTKAQIRNLYAKWRAQDPHLAKAIYIAARQLYPIIVRECTYTWKGKRGWCHGADAVSCEMQRVQQEFVEEFERTGTASFQLFDQVLWVAHHNGYLAHRYIESDGEDDAVAFLSDVSGIQR